MAGTSAGLQLPNYSGYSYPGLTPPPSGSYGNPGGGGGVLISPYTGKQIGQTSNTVPSAVASQPGAPQYSTSPTGAVSQYNPSSGTWMPSGVVGQSEANFQQSLGPSSKDIWAHDMAVADRDKALNSIKALMDSQGGAPSATAPQIPEYRGSASSPYDMAAENAAYGAAKERTGAALQSALKGLKGVMAARGISGSGIEGGETRQLFESGLSDLAGTDRQLAEQRASRAFTAGQSDVDRMINTQEFNASLTANQTRANQEAAAQRLSQLLSVYGNLY